MKYMNYFFACAIGMMLKTLIPQYQAAAGVPNAETYLMDTLSNAVEIAEITNSITPPVLSDADQKLDHFSQWYNQEEYLLAHLLEEARKAKGASVRAMIAKEETNGVPWMRVVYDDCRDPKAGCVTVNYGHLQPIKNGDTWSIRRVIYPNARSRILEQTNGIYVLKPGIEIPYNIRDYVQKYYPIALEHEKRYGIPWPVKLAQGLFESAAGTSKLARNHNQHFGIKAPANWKGKRAGAKDEGGKVFNFAAHESGEESYEFHSQFLKAYSRYEGVFKYHPDSTYNYTFRVLARDYWNRKAYKPVYHIIGGKKTRLLDGKVYKLSGLEIATIELSRAGYASDYNYSIGLMNTIHKFAEPNN